MAEHLITGITGSLAQLVAQRLMRQGHTVVGVDYRRAPPHLHPDIRFYQANYNKTRIEDVFKRHRFDRVLHLGRVGNLKEDQGKRFDLNVVGTQKIMNLCLQHAVKRLVVFSTFHIYGAHPHNHIPISEEDPLRSGMEFPQLGDAIQLDNMASTWVYKHPEVATVVLRPTNVVGPTIQNAMSSFLRAPRIPHLMGFNPMTQFIHEQDMADAVTVASESAATGVFNVAGAGVMPWRSALKLAHARTFPIPAELAMAYMKMATRFPLYLVNFFRYPCVITDKAFRDTFGWAPALSMEDTIWDTVKEARLLSGVQRRT